MVAKSFHVTLICTVILFCEFESAYVDTLVKCSKDDKECLKNVIKSVLRDTSKTGIPEYSIPTFDPYVIHNETLSILNILDVSLYDGTVTGVKDCIVNDYEVNFDKKQTTMDFTCDIKVKGKYTAQGSSDLLKQLLGGQTVKGNGQAKISIDKLHLKSTNRFRVIKKDGDIFIISNRKDIELSYKIGKMSFSADNIYLGDTESSALVTNIMNENWKLIVDTLGKPFIDRVTSVVYEESSKFFRAVPAKYYLAEDLSQYVTSE